MLVLSIRTEKPQAEIGLFEDIKKIDYVKWQAHRELSVTIHKKIQDLLKANAKNLNNLEGIICYSGPGSFTGLRIGISTANTLASSLNIPIVSANGNEWLKESIKKLLAGNNEKIALPEYGEHKITTKPK